MPDSYRNQAFILYIGELRSPNPLAWTPSLHPAAFSKAGETCGKLPLPILRDSLSDILIQCPREGQLQEILSDNAKLGVQALRRPVCKGLAAHAAVRGTVAVEGNGVGDGLPIGIQRIVRRRLISVPYVIGRI